MNRRDALLTFAALGLHTAPFIARAQSEIRSVAVLSTDAADSQGIRKVKAFRAGLSEEGLVDGRDIRIEVQWASGRYERLPALAADFVNKKVAVIFAASLPSALAAKAATQTIPIVFVMGADPVKLGVVASLPRPGGNVTGISQLYGALGAKRLELLRELVPTANAFAVLSNPKNANAKEHASQVEAAARAVGISSEIFDASTDKEIDAAFAAVQRKGLRAMLVADDPFFNVQRRQIVALAARYALPVIHYARDFVALGGLISYGSDVNDNYRLAGGYVGKILKGANPAELPVVQPTRFELVVNLKTAKILGLAIPSSLLLRADEVIQ